MIDDNQERGQLMPAILSIQSAVAYGHVGNNAATLPLQRLGFDVWPVNTVQLGHHPGYGRFAGHIVEPDRVSVIIDGVLEQAPLATCAGLLVGYLGDVAIADHVIGAWQAIHTKQPGSVFLLDPVIGDDGPGVFVKEAVPAAIRDRLLPLAQIVTPNRFELAWLSGQEVNNIDQARQAAVALLDLGPDLVVATGLSSPDHPDHLGILAVSRGQTWLVLTPRLSQHFSGTGDAFSALLLGHFLQAPDTKTTLERAATAIFSLVEITAERGDSELSIVAAQDVMAAPTKRFPATRLT
ncbi:MAG: pyridoxal kinase PdxY [Geminicoccales bacterium]